MIYLEYEKNTKYVIEIHEVEPTNIISENLICKTNKFNIGDEFQYLIIVNEVDENGFAVSISAIQQARSYSLILKENEQLKKRLLESENAIVTLMDLQMGGL
jgi:hypothetical protein